MSDQIDTRTAWLSPELLASVRSNVPLVYVDAIPVRVDESGRVTQVGLLLRVASDGSISRMLVSGRVLYGERVRDALIRHLEKDLGPLALPKVPTNPAPFTIAEYFPDPDISSPSRGELGLRGSRFWRLHTNSASTRSGLVYTGRGGFSQNRSRYDGRARPTVAFGLGSRRRTSVSRFYITARFYLAVRFFRTRRATLPAPS